ncbi:hypothetical protein CEQ90_17335 [Lewinellaceae bacterium SD302]|nr:hypothetical protein CEQ90_17335 [Lewinellaceae bacterium SD302]
MLAKLILIKACTYDLAELDFSHGDAMQLVGGNNVGKSSLIYALNFLFVIDRRRMSFMGRKSADKTTMEYYFPTAESSFIVFEVSKRGRRYCIIVWRDGSGAPQYARLDHAYERTLFFDIDGDNGLRPLSLSQLRRKWVVAGLKLKPLKNLKEISRNVYHTGRANDAVVWLKNSGHGKSAESFSILYRYLIDTKLITDIALREILLLADHRTESKLTYANANLNDIERLRQQKSSVDLLKKHQATFERFRHDFQRLDGERAELWQMSAAFKYHSTLRRAEIAESQTRYGREITDYQEELQVLHRKSATINQQIGGLNIQLKTARRDQEQAEEKRKKIQALPTPEFLTSSRENVVKLVRGIEFQLTELGHSGLSPAELEQRITRSESEIARLELQRNNIADWLIFQLAENDEDRRRLNAILSNQVSRLDAAALRDKISSTESLVRLFDGAFELPADFKVAELPTPEQISSEIAETQETLERNRRLLAASRNRVTLVKELANKKKLLEEFDLQLRQLEQLPALSESITALNQQTKAWEQERTELNQQAATVAEEIKSRNKALEIIKDKQRELTGEEQKILGWLGRMEKFRLDIAEEYIPTGDKPPLLAKLFAEIERRYRELEDLINQTRYNFILLKRELLSETADENSFIEEIEQDYQSLDDKVASIDSLVDNIGQRFANPAADFLHQFELFRDFINQKFNRSLSKLSISNIESLRIELQPNASLQRDLQKIGELDLDGNSLFAPERGSISVLRRYIEQGRDVSFSELFSLQLKLTIGGKEKNVDLSKQVESDGTDRMLRLVIVMQVISRLVDLSPENRIVMFIDEIATIDGKNRPQLVDFCREHHFYPIFAAPEMVEGFDRYVLISRGANKRLVVEAEKNYVDVQRT